MILSLRNWLGHLSTAGKLLLILSAAVLPLGLVLVWAATQAINQTNTALTNHADDQGRIVSRAVESLIARNVLALRIAGSGVLRDGSPDPCATAARSLALAPGIASRFELADPAGQPFCRTSNFRPDRPTLLVKPGEVRLWVSDGGSALYYRVGLVGGQATGLVTEGDLRGAAISSASQIDHVDLTDGTRTMMLIDQPAESTAETDDIARERLVATGILLRSVVSIQRIASVDRLVLLLPLLMWIVASLLSWLLVSQFLIRPLRSVQKAVSGYQPGGEPFALPTNLGSATEIEELGQAFARAVERIEFSEHQMGEALAGQRKLVREVHHRVKNNLQVVASLLNIHGRSAATIEARAAYASIGRRVDALAVVHRNHYAELEDNQGIALRSLLGELASSLRSSAPEEAHSLNIDLDLETVNSTQDVAVAVAFFTTEIVEFAMLRCPDEPLELQLRRNGDRTARFSLSSPVLDPDLADDPDRRQFERIIAGLAKQLRSTLEKTMGRYSVDLPVFPPRPI